MKAATRVAKNTGILYARMAITVLISLYTTRIILGALGEKDFGLFNVVGGAIAMLGFLNASMTAASQRFISFAHGAGESDRVKQIFNVSIALHATMAIAIFFVLEAVGYFLFNGILNIAQDRVAAAKLVYQFMIISTLFTVVGVPYDAVINAHENMLLFAILSIIESVFKLIIAFYVVKTSGDKLITYGMLMAALSVFLLLLRWIYCRRKYIECKISLRTHYSGKLMKEMTGFAGWSLIGSSSSMVSNYGQGVVLNMFFGTVVNAAQGIANQISGQLGVFSVTMLKALNPVIAKSAGAGDRDLMIRSSLMGSKLSFFLLLFLYVPVLIEMPYMFHLWLNNVPEYAVLFCRLLLLQNLIKQLFITLNTTIFAVGKIRQYQVWFSILTFLTLPITYFLFSKHFPPAALYVVFIIYSLIYGGMILYFAKKTFSLSIKVFFKEVMVRCWGIFLFLLAVSSMPALLMNEGCGRLITVIGVSTLTFLLTVWYVGLADVEKKIVKDILLPVSYRIPALIGIIRRIRLKYE